MSRRYVPFTGCEMCAGTGEERPKRVAEKFESKHWDGTAMTTAFVARRPLCDGTGKDTLWTNQRGAAE